jgi:hypothetical protein
LQHPLGVHFIPEKNVVLVADTYNHKIKVIDPFRNEIFTWLGNGKAILKDDNTFNSSFNEPSGFGSLFDAFTNDVKVYIADCNNHCIRRVLYDQGDATTVEFKGVPAVVDDDIGGGGREYDETEGTTTNKSGLDEDAMALECDGNNCYPKFF